MRSGSGSWNANLIGMPDGEVGCREGRLGDELELSGRLSRCAVMMAHRARCRIVRRRDERRCSFTGVIVEFGQQVVLRLGDCFGVTRGNFGGGFGLASEGFGFAHGAFGFFSEKGAVTLGLGVTFSNRGGDAGGSLAGCR